MLQLMYDVALSSRSLPIDHNKINFDTRVMTDIGIDSMIFNEKNCCSPKYFDFLIEDRVMEVRGFKKC